MFQYTETTNPSLLTFFILIRFVCCRFLIFVCLVKCFLANLPVANPSNGTAQGAPSSRSCCKAVSFNTSGAQLCCQCWGSCRSLCVKLLHPHLVNSELEDVGGILHKSDLRPCQSNTLQYSSLITHHHHIYIYTSCNHALLLPESSE